MSRLGAISFACLMLAACEAPVTDESQLSPSVLDWCFFEATAPADATVEDIASEFQSNRRFCSWRSFSEHKFVGQTFMTTRDNRKPSDLLYGVPNTGPQVCDARSMIDAGWKLKSIKVDDGRQVQELCTHGVHQMDNHMVGVWGRQIVDLPQLCFGPTDPNDVSPNYAWHPRAFGSTVAERWTVPVRFFRLDEDAGLIRFWFDGAPDAAWKDQWAEIVVMAAAQNGRKLAEVPCANQPSTGFDASDL